MQVESDDDDDLHGWQRSREFKYSKLCPMATKLCQRITNDDDDDLHGRQR